MAGEGVISVIMIFLDQFTAEDVSNLLARALSP
jgi:hypothetical protein